MMAGMLGRGDLARGWEAWLEEGLRSRQCDRAGFAGPGRVPLQKGRSHWLSSLDDRDKVALVTGLGHLVTETRRG